jgi:hypothetical protein
VQTDFSQIGPPLFAVLVVFLVYRRLRRNFGRQPLRPVRMRVRIALLAIIGCALLPMALRSAQYLSAELGGLLAGIGLALWGAHRTRFQMVEGRLHYLPHTYTGIAVSLLFLGRLVYRLVQFYSIAHTGHDGVADNPAQAFAPGSMVRSPLTVAILYVLIGYYVCYYSLVLYKSKHLKPEDAEAVSIAPAQ